MGTVILHAGMPKAGSSSIQSWLEAAAADLRRDGISVLLATQRGADHVRVVPHESGSVVSGDFLYGYLGFDRDRAIRDRFVEGLDRWTSELGTTVITAEGFANLFTPPDPAFLGALDDLGRRHDVRVAYYVRPQHTSMEAAWCQWGYRMDEPPSTYLSRWAETLDYLATSSHVQAAAPHVRFEVRPFRADLLLGGDVVSDFAQHFLGVAGPAERLWSNRGFSLDVVNVLRGAPPGLLWRSPHDNRALDRIRPALHAVEVAPTAEAERSRRILQRYGHDRFEAANRELIDRLGWPTEAFVPAPDPDPAGAGVDGVGATLAALDDLWSVPSAEVTRALLLGVLGGLGGLGDGAEPD